MFFLKTKFKYINSNIFHTQSIFYELIYKYFSNKHIYISITQLYITNILALNIRLVFLSTI